MRSYLFLSTQGVRLYTERKWAEAEAAFQKAWALNPTFDVAYNLGNTEYRLGKYRDAAEHFAFALHVWPLIESAAGLRSIAEKRLAESKAFVGALTVKVKVNVAKAEVLVDGKAVGTAPLATDVFVAPGTHTIEARLAGYTSAKEAVALDKGAARTIELKLLAAMATTDANGAKPGAGAEKRPNVGSVEGESSEGGPHKGVLIAGIASSAVAITGGVVFAIVSSVNAGDAASRRAALLEDNGGKDPCLTSPLPAGCEEFRSSLAAKGTFGNLSAWSFVLGGALGAGTAIYALTASAKRQPTSSVRAVPVASADAAGVVLIGRW